MVQRIAASQSGPGASGPQGASGALSEGVFQRAHRLIRRLLAVYAVLAGVVIVFLALSLWPEGGLSRIERLAQEAISGGLAAIVLPALLLSLTGLVGTVLLTAARQNPAFAASLKESQALGDPELGLGASRGTRSAGFAARIGQGVAIPCGAALTGLATWLLWPAANETGVSGDGALLAAFVFSFAFISLIAERVLNAVAAPLLGEAPSLRRLLLMTTVLLVAAGCLEVGRGAGLSWVRWIVYAAASLPWLVGAELALRAGARLFMPAPAGEKATAVTDSILAALLTGGPRAPGALIRTHLGIDFARSWAINYIARAALPAVFLTALLCWCLSGLKLVDLDQRGVYERLGAPVAVLGPGLHLLLPWPLGRLRPVEFGIIHTIAVGSNAPPEAGDQIAAEAIPPDSADRLWTTPHATEVNYLVASQSGAVQSFQVVSTEILVLYRTGLSDRDAMKAAYGTADQQAVVRDASSRLATRFFGQRTLDDVMGDQPKTLAEGLRRDLAADVARADVGIEIMAVVIEEIHPPAGAAAAYHMVQAAEINANASISDEIGRATRMIGVANEESHQIDDASQARATEMLRIADAASYRFHADRVAYGIGRQSFLLERSLTDIGMALAHSPLTLIDYRLPANEGPLLDLRGVKAPADVTAAASASFTAPVSALEKESADAPPGVFTYVPAGSTADTAAPTPDAAQDVPGGVAQ